MGGEKFEAFVVHPAAGNMTKALISLIMAFAKKAEGQALDQEGERDCIASDGGCRGRNDRTLHRQARFQRAVERDLLPSHAIVPRLGAHRPILRDGIFQHGVKSRMPSIAVFYRVAELQEKAPQIVKVVEVSSNIKTEMPDAC